MDNQNNKNNKNNKQGISFILLVTVITSILVIALFQFQGMTSAAALWNDRRMTNDVKGGGVWGAMPRCM